MMPEWDWFWAHYLPTSAMGEVLCWCFIIRCVGLIRFRRKDSIYSNYAFFARWPIYMYVGFLAILTSIVYDFLQEVQNQDGARETQTKKLQSLPGVNHTLMEKCMTYWEENDSLEGYAALHYFCKLAPFCAVGTVLVSMYNTGQHYRKVRGDLYWQWSREYTIWLLALPPVYAMMALYSVTLRWHSARNGGYNCGRAAIGSDTETYSLEMRDLIFETPLCLGDGYEGMALLLFAEITLGVINAGVESKVKKLDTKLVEHESLASISRRNIEIGEEATGSQILEPRYSAEVKEVEDVAVQLEKSTTTLAVLGIRYFCYSCFLQAFPTLIICQANRFGWAWAGQQMLPAYLVIAPQFKGAGFITSCLAIENIMQIESSFEHKFLHSLHTVQKFLSVKLMVSFVFMQSAAIPMIFRMSEHRTQMVDASLRCVELFAISVFNLWAWKPGERWFHDLGPFPSADGEVKDSRGRLSSSDKADPLLENA